MAESRISRVKREERNLRVQAFERWKGFQPNIQEIRAARPNRDGTVPRPRVGQVTPEQRVRFEAREQVRAVFESVAFRDLRIAAERQIGATLDFAGLPPDEQAVKAGRPVVRLVLLGGPGIVPQGFATGFLIHPSLIVTNHHVFRGPDEAEGVAAQFLYERTHEGLREGLFFELEPDRFFINDKGLDYAIVAVKARSTTGAPLDQFRYLPLIGAKGKIRKGDPVNIIQHPEGRPKQYATVNNRLLDLRDDGFLLYETDTLEGSSGSPVFNQHWEVIGLHHCGVPLIENDLLVTRSGSRLPLDAEVADSDLIWVANEGIRVTALVESFGRQRPETAEQRTILVELCASTLDPLRIVSEKSPIDAGQTADVMANVGVGDATMAQNVFQFSGPVTIHVGGVHALPTGSSRSAEIPPRDTATTVPPLVSAEFREKTLKFDERYDRRDQQGYDENFLPGWEVQHPHVGAKHNGKVLRRDGETWVIPYYHYSLVMNEDRRLLAWAASNVDYSAAARKFTKTRKAYGGENWRPDPRVATERPGLQLEDADFYKPAGKIDRGHIVRREDGAWGGDAREAEFGNSDTYHWTNCTPQHEAFNQSGKDGIWGQFEEHIQREIKADGGRMTVFAGPVLNPDDPEPKNEEGDTIQVPMEYWKVVIAVSQEAGESVRRAYGFVFDQTEPVKKNGFGFERLNMDDFEIFQMTIRDITKKTGIEFDETILAADVLRAGADESIRGFERKRIRSLAGVVLR